MTAPVVRPTLHPLDLASVRAWVEHEDVAHHPLSLAVLRALVAEVERLRGVCASALPRSVAGPPADPSRLVCPACGGHQLARYHVRAKGGPATATCLCGHEWEAMPAFGTPPRSVMARQFLLPPGAPDAQDIPPAGP